IWCGELIELTPGMLSNNNVSPSVFLASGDRDLVKMIKAVALQAPVSDRESISLTPGDHDASIQYARKLVADKNGDEMMPETRFGPP
ncbi:hypothetical protein THAOC_27024, partial [Thalassiosira oceanica]